MLEAWKAQRKQQIVYEIDKIVATMHALIFADGVLGAKNARDCSQKQYFDAGMERTNGDRNGEKNERANQITNNGLIEAVWESKFSNFWLKSLEGVLQKWSSRFSRNNIFENM